MIPRFPSTLTLALTFLVLPALSSLLLSSDQRLEAAEPHVVFITGDHEYRSEVSMPMIAKLLEKNYGFKCTVLYAINKQTGKIDSQEEENIPGLEALDTADLAVVFLRWRRLPEDQFNRLLKYAESGKPLVGIRTATHPLNYPEGHPLAKWNNEFPIKFFGQRWITHHGHESSTDVTTALGQNRNPILEGVRPFHARSWLYHVAPLEGKSIPVLEGTAHESNKVGQESMYPQTQPVAWTKINDSGAKVFFTTLGHPLDFENESMRRLLVNGIFWALGKEIPQNGTNVEPAEPYIAPESNAL